MATASTLKYNRVQRIKDSKFNIDEINQYTLILQMGIHDLQFAVIDSKISQCMVVEDYQLEGLKSLNNRLDLLKKIVDEHDFLLAGFWKDVTLTLKTHKFTLVPDVYFQEDNAQDYLALNGEVKTAFENVLFYKHKSIDTINIFAAEIKLTQWVESLYQKKKVHIIHQGSAMLEGVFKHSGKIQERAMYCLLDRGMMHIVVIEKQQLLYYNQFPAQSIKEQLKCIFLVLKELKMSNKKHRVFLWGFVKQPESEIKIFQKYLHNVAFGEKPSFIKFGFVFDEMEEHQYFDLLSGYLCD